jgi:hypothetical protein
MLNNKAINITEVNVRKIEGAIKNGQCRETGNIGYTRYKTKTKKTQKKPPKNPARQYVLDTTIRKQTQIT